MAKGSSGVALNEGIVYEFAAEPSGDQWDVVRWIEGSPQHKIHIMTYPTMKDAAYLVQTLQLIEIRHRLQMRSQMNAGIAIKRRRA